MTTVFVAGSRAISKLDDQIRERLDNIMRQQLSVLVGHASGVDKAVQAYLAKCAYRNVTVYSMQVSRNNVCDFMFRPPGLLTSPIVPTAATYRRRAAEALSSEQNMLCYLSMHRIS